MHLKQLKEMQSSKKRCVKGVPFVNRKYTIFVIDSYLKDSAFTAVKRDAKF